MFEWFADTLRQYPEIAIFLSLAFGYYFGSFTYKGLGLGAVTATLIAAVIIGQLGITITGPLKPFFFLMFLFAIGYGVGPQFVRGIAKDGIPQALFAVVRLRVLPGRRLSRSPRWPAMTSVRRPGSMPARRRSRRRWGLATDAINRLGLPPEETKNLLDAMPVAYAVTYIFGTVGSAVIIALLGPALLGIDLEAACKRYEEKHGGKKAARRARHGLAPIRAARIPRAAGRRRIVGKTAAGSRGAASRTAGLRPAHPPRRQDHGRHRRHRDPGGRRRGGGRPPRGAGQPDRHGSGGSRRSRAAGGAGRGRRRLRDQQGGRRKDAGRAGESVLGARRVPAQDHPRRDRDRHPDPAGHARSIAATSSPSSAAPRI